MTTTYADSLPDEEVTGKATAAGETFSFPLSFAQQRLWFIDRMSPGAAHYNMPFAMRLSGRLNLAALNMSLAEVVRRHESLRTRFAEIDGQPRQIVETTASTRLAAHDLIELPETEREAEAHRLAYEEARQPFDLSAGPLLRVTLMRLSEDDHILLLTMHHIISDGWSMGVLVREVAALYEAFSRGGESPLPELEIQYGDFAEWQREWLQGEVLEGHLRYWREQLAGAPAMLELPTDRPRPPAQTFNGAQETFFVPEEVCEGLRRLSRQEGATLFMTLLAAWQALLSRYSGQRDVLTGTPIAGRNQMQTEGLIGFFVNTLVLRTQLEAGATFRRLLGRVREVTLGAYAHQDVPFERLVEELQPERSLSHTPLFQVMLTLQNAPAGELQLPELTISMLEGGKEAAKFDLSLAMQESEGGISGSLAYRTDLFDRDTARRLTRHFLTLLANVSEQPDAPVAGLPLMSAAERQEQLLDWNDTFAPYSSEKAVHQLFENQVEINSDRPACEGEGGRATYGELNRRANQLANYLRGLGVGPEVPVGILMRRSVEMLVAVLGVLKAGGAFVPLDEALPAERLSFMLADAGVDLVVTQDDLSARVSLPHGRVLSLDSEGAAIAQEKTENPFISVAPGNSAYIIYTSGSTGKPKGTIIEHGSVVNYLEWVNRTLMPCAAQVVPQVTSLSFDACLKQLLAPLLRGGKVWMLSAEVARQPEKLLAAIGAQTGVTLNCVPSLWSALLDVAESGAVAVPEESLTELLVGGEPLKAGLIERTFQAFPHLRVWNLYGPSEATANACFAEILPHDVITIGRPLDNTQIYILGEDLEPVPVGVIGEIYIGGVGLARGYVNHPDLTADRFIPHPFSTQEGARLYQTGDLARYLSDGRIDFRRRRDQQVKVRGFRIELGEIETALREHPSIHDAVVVASEDKRDEVRLVAYVVGAREQSLSISELHAFLKETLPDYMLPQMLVNLEQMPRTPSGKLDRQALPAPDAAGLAAGGPYAAPQTAVEEILAGLWGGLLGASRVGLHDNFFDLGGHSLLATQVISRLRQTFHVDLPLRQMFEAPTVYELAQRIETAMKGGAGLQAPPMVAVGRSRQLPLSFAQQRLWFIHQLDPSSPLYNMPVAVRLTGALDLPALERTLDEISRRHEALRTSFPVSAAEPVQVIHPHLPQPLPVTDLSALPASERESEVARLAAEEARRPFDLSAGRLVRRHLLRVGAEEHVLLWTMHHIISDGWSMGVLVREVGALYQAYREGQESPLAELAMQYGDFAVWQREWLQGEVLEEQLGYWRGQLAGAPAVLELPTDRPRPAVQSSRGASERREVYGEVAEGLRRVGREQGATLFMTLLAAWQVLLWRYSGQQDVVVGTPIANRNRREIEDLIGFFVNTLVLRGEVREGESYQSLLERVKEVTLGAYAHQDVPFEMLVEELQPERSLSHTPLFQVMFVLQNAPQDELHFPGLTLSPVQVSSSTAKFDLLLTIQESGEGLNTAIEYNTDLFEAATIRRMLGHFEAMLTGIADDPAQDVRTLPILTAGEEQQLLVDWNATQATYPREQCAHYLFEQQAARTPDAIAVVFDGEALSYAQLNERANRLAHYLRGLGVGPDGVVGVLMERSLEMTVGVLGVLKAGGAYLPLDPEYPQERLAFMLDNAQARVLLSLQRMAGRLPSHQARVLNVDSEWPAIAQESAENPARNAAADSLAYIIYTSGSTGRPKGVAMPHRPLVNLVLFQMENSGAGNSWRTLQFASLSFDVSFQEMFSTWLAGATLVLVRDEVRRDARELWRLISDERVERLFLPFVALQHLAEAAGTTEMTQVHLREVITAGEQLKITPHVERMFNRLPLCLLVNQYGPSEAHVVSWLKLPRGGAGEWPPLPPIGRPVSNSQLYVLDPRLQPVPVGVAGELFIGGDCLARGYLYRPGDSAEKFIPHPFAAVGGQRLYRTGDLARFLANGDIEFLGRRDEQVKVRGHRIELGEVEAVVQRHELVREVIVTAHEGATGEKRLVAYVIAEPGRELKLSDLRDHLRDRLPEYMIPTFFEFLDEFPRTPSGKLDRQALPAPDAAGLAAGGPYAAPQTAVEEILAGLWGGLLGASRVGLHDNFFDLGGHSLLATQLMSRLRDVFHVQLPLRSLFERPTVSGLAQVIEQELAAGRRLQAPPMVAVGRDRRLPLSFAQQRLWFIHQLDPSSPLYNMPVAVRLTGALDVAALARTVNEIMRRHEVLRTHFEVAGGTPVQVVEGQWDAGLEVADLSGLGEAEREAEAARAAAGEAGAPFDLGTGPVLRARLLRMGEREHVFLLTMHHIVSDGWSMGVLIREVGALYGAYARGEGSPLAELEIQYGDFAVWQREWLQGEVLEEQLSYWREQLAGASGVLELPTDRPRPAVQSSRGASERREVCGEVAEGLRRVGREQGATLFMTLLAAWQALLSRYSGQRDVLTGTPIAGRNQMQTEGLIGFFVNTLVLRTQVEAGATFRRLLGRVREVTLGAYAHQDVPFERLVEELQPERSLSHTPLFQVMLTLQNAPAGELQLPGLTLSALAGARVTEKFDLSLDAQEDGNTISLGLGYNTDIFDAPTIKRMLAHFKRLLEGVVAHPDQPLDSLSLLSEEEQRQLLDGRNETQADYPSERCAHELFEEQAARTPEAVAVIHAERQLTYRELNDRANQLARYLRGLGVGPDGVVGILMERSLEMAVGVLGVLKAGGAYVPVDPTSPHERAAFILEDAGARVLLTQANAQAGPHPRHTLTTVCLDADWSRVAQEDETNLRNEADPSNLAYVIYTSGSTGRPKGVMVPHRGLVNYLSWCTRAYRVAEGGGAAVHSPLSFDLTVTSLFAPLLVGRSVAMISDGAGVEKLGDALRAGHDFSLVKLTPAHLEMLSQTLPAENAARQTRALIVGGEALLSKSLSFWREHAPETVIVNEYGPTETVVGCCVYEVVARDIRDGTIPIGRPIANTQLYVLDGRMQPVPSGVSGELYIGGEGVARGYLNRPALTAASFVPHPFSRQPGARLYRTGDLARYRSDEQLEYLGRIDQQVKVRGFRIELGEIEAVLASHQAVREVAVVAREDQRGDKRLVAYAVVDREQIPTFGEMRRFLQERLPDYMIPSAFVMVDEIPLTPNGKLDQRKLPAPELANYEQGRTFVAPRDVVELGLAKIWEELLNLSPVGVRDDFFELGGHSMLAASMMSRIQKWLGVSLPFTSLFQEATIEHLAGLLRHRAEPAKAFSSLVEIQPGASDAPPFFCVHPSGGNVLCYLELARHLSLGQAFYGLQSNGLDENVAPHTTVEEMATHYIEAMRGVQPDGAYFLGGWSMGGLVAFEMAQQLRSQGREVAMLALFDTHLPDAEKYARMDELSYLASFAQDLGLALDGMTFAPDELRNLGADEQLGLILEHSKAANILPPDYDASALERLFRIFKINVQAMLTYVPRAYAGRVTLFRAADSRATGPRHDSTGGWQRLASGGLEIHHTPGTHHSIVRPPHVEVLADQLTNSLNALPDRQRDELRELSHSKP